MNFILLKNILTKVLLGMILFFPISLFAQQGRTAAIEKITIENGALNFWVKILDDGRPAKIAKGDAFIGEGFKGDSLFKTIENLSKHDTIVYAENKEKEETSTLSFLVDVGSGVTEESLFEAQRMIKQVMEERAVYKNIDFYISAFHNALVVERKKVTLETLDAVLTSLRPTPEDPDFYRILIEEIKYLKSLPGNKALFILGTGENIAGGERYHRQLPYELEDINNLIKKLPFNFQIFIADLNEDTDAVSFAGLGTGNVAYAYHALPSDYIDKLADNKVILSTHLIKAFSSQPKFKGKKRAYTLNVKGNKKKKAVEAKKDFRLGTINYPVNIRQQSSWLAWLVWLVAGIIAILLILGIGSLLVPYIKEQDFIKKYVKPYVLEEGRVRYDIIYNEPIQEGQLIVAKCQQITPFTTWKANGWQCPNYSTCEDMKCKGQGAPELNDFFTMEGIFLKLNWIWLGTIGGLLAWIIITLFRLTNFQMLNSILAGLVGNDFLNSISQGNSALVIQTIGNNVLVGIALGSGLMLMLSWMEERRSSNRYSIKGSIGRVLLRTFIGTVLSAIVFWFGFYLQYVLGVGSYMSGLISWLLFGIGIGVIISIRSSISAMNGIIGGITAAVIAFQVYWGLSEFLDIGFMQANLVSMILLGGIIGAVLVSVVTTLEDYELEVIAPFGYQRTIPISKWLKSNVGVMIGKMPGSYIYIKWDDEAVRPEHAELFTENGVVFIRPIEEILLNRALISKPHPLKNGDVIQLGRSSVTQFRFIEK